MSFLLSLWRLLSLPKNFQLAIIRRFQASFLVGVTGVIFKDKKEILVCKHTYRQRAWSLPGGYMNAREHPREGLEREIKEETGFIVSVDEEYKVRTDRETARLDITCIGTYMGGTFRPSKEVSEARFFSFDNLPLISPRQLTLIKEVLEYTESSSRSTPKTGRRTKYRFPRSVLPQVVWKFFGSTE